MDWHSLPTGAVCGLASGLIVPMLQSQWAWRVEQTRLSRQMLKRFLALA